MKKLTLILLGVLLVTMLFVACKMEVNESDNGALTLRFRTDDTSKSLSASRTAINTSEYIWYYTASKSDGTPATGTTTEQVKIGENGLSATVGPFSLGSWNFVLYGYKAFQSDAKLVYKGSVTGYKLTSKTTSIDIMVEPQKTASGMGTIVVSKDIKLTANGQEYPATTVTVTGVDVNYEGSSTSFATDTRADLSFENLTSGSYKVVVSYVVGEGDSAVTYASNTIYVNVWNCLTTTIDGTLDETTVSPTFNAEDGTISSNVAISDGSEGEYSFNFSPAGVATSEDTASNKTTIKATFKKTSDTSGDAKLVVTTYDATSATNSQTFTVTTDGKESTETPVAGITATLENAEFASDSVAVITTYIAKDFSSIKLYRVSNGESTLMTSVTAENDVDVNGEYYYDKSTGKLVFATSSFSSFYVSSDDVAYIKSTNKAYSKLEDAITAANGNTITLINNVSVTSKITVAKGTTLDINLNQKTITFDGSSSLSTAFDNNGTLCLSNGTIKYEKGRNLISNESTGTVTNYAIISNSGTLNVSSLTIDADVIAECNVALSSITGAIADANSCPGVFIVLNKGTATFDNAKLDLEVTVKDDKLIDTTDSNSMKFAGTKPMIIYQQEGATTEIKGSVLTASTKAPGGVLGLYIEVGESSATSTTTATISNSTIEVSNFCLGWGRPVFADSKDTEKTVEVTITNSKIISKNDFTDTQITNAGLSGKGFSAKDNRVYGLRAKGNSIIKFDSDTTVTIENNDGTEYKYSTDVEDNQGTAKDNNIAGQIIDTTNKTWYVNSYEGLTTALNAGASSIILSGDITSTETIKVTKSLTLDLDGHTITVASGNGIESDGFNVEIKSTSEAGGNITASADGSCGVCVKNGTLTITGSNLVISGACAGVVLVDGTGNITNATVKTTKQGSWNAVLYVEANTTDATLTITDCTLEKGTGVEETLCLNVKTDGKTATINQSNKTNGVTSSMAFNQSGVGENRVDTN